MPQASYCSSCGSRIFVDSQGQDTSDPYLGQVIDNTFVVESILGTGSMGIVYKARHLALDCHVALKVLRHDFLQDRVVLARFQREAQAASSLNHPNVIRILHYGKTFLNAPYIAMECLNGDELSVLVPKAFPLPQKRVCSIALQTARALSSAHAANIIHRDLKPANIVVTHDDTGDEIVKVLDFGIAKIADVEGEGLTKEGAVCGTPAFMSPEQVLGRTVTPISDLFSLGCVMYFMLTCRLPFQGQSMVDMATAILTTNPQPPSKARIDTYVDPTLEKICMKALSKEPEDRYQSAVEMVHALEDAYRNMPDVDPKVRPKIVVGSVDDLDDLEGETRCGIEAYAEDDDDNACTQLDISAMDDDVSGKTSVIEPALPAAIMPPHAIVESAVKPVASARRHVETVITPQNQLEEDEDDGGMYFAHQLRAKNKRLMLIAVSIAMGVSVVGNIIAFIISRSAQEDHELISSEVEQCEGGESCVHEAVPPPVHVETPAEVFIASNRAQELLECGIVAGCAFGVGFDRREHIDEDDDEGLAAELEQAERERIEREKADREQAEREQAEREKAEREKAERRAKAEREKAERPIKPRPSGASSSKSSGGSSLTERLAEAGRFERSGQKERACVIYRSLLGNQNLSQGDKLKIQAKIRSSCGRGRITI